MTGYVDSSCIVAMAFREAGAERVALKLYAYQELLSSNLLEAEVRATARRHSVEFSADWLENIAWVNPERPLSEEMLPVFAKGHLRGADAWHIACALYLAGTASEPLDFLTLDRRQGEVAALLGFAVPDLGAI